ncbi:MAG: hypothetical protein WBP56_06375 [Polyangia bacterium]
MLSHWSAAELRDAFAASADGADIGTRTVARVLDQAEIQPHRIRYFLTSRDPEFDQKRRDIVGLYLRPPEGATVLCLDEKPSIQALGRKNPDLPLCPGLPLYREFEYVRHGVVHLFAAFNTRSGRVLGEVQEKKTRFEFIELLDLCAWHYKRGRETQGVRCASRCAVQLVPVVAVPAAGRERNAARLPLYPSQPRALATLLESLVAWHRLHLQPQ